MTILISSTGLPLITSGGGLVVSTTAGSAPTFTTQPAFGQSSYVVGNTVNFSLGVTDGGETPTIEFFTLDGVDKTAEISGTSWNSTGETPGTIALRTRATNAFGSTLSNTVTATLVSSSAFSTSRIQTGTIIKDKPGGTDTWYFNKTVSYIWSANGDPILLTQSPYMDGTGAAITQIAPASDVDGSGYRRSGAMRNHTQIVEPWSSMKQGFDAAAKPDSSQSIPYDATLNIDPGATGSNYSIAQNSTGTIIKAIRTAAYSAGAYAQMAEYRYLGIMSTLPPRDGTPYRPGCASATKAWPSKMKEEVDLSGGASSILRNLTKPGSLNRASAYLTEVVTTKKLRGIPAHMSTYRGRGMQIAAENPQGYAEQSAPYRYMYLSSLFTDPAGAANPTTEQTAREDLAHIMIQWGLDALDGHALGQNGGSGAGQWMGKLGFMYLAAFAMGSATLLGYAKAHKANNFWQCFWIREEHIGYPIQADTGSTASNSKFHTRVPQVEHLGKPDWIREGVNAASASLTSGEAHYMSTSPLSAYRTVPLIVPMFAVVAIGLLRNGPSGETGIEAINGGATMAPGQPNRTAILPMVDRIQSHFPINDSSTWWYSESVISRSVFNTWRDEIRDSAGTAIPRSAFKPDMMAMVDAANFSTGGASGQISFTVGTHDYAMWKSTTHPITNREVAWSQDGVQFTINSIGTSTTTTISSLRPGTAYWCKWRHANSLGWSPWSETWPQNRSGSSYTGAYQTDRHKVTSGGGATPGGAYVNVAAPVIHYNPYPIKDSGVTDTPYYEVAPTTLSTAPVYKGSAASYGTFAVERLVCGVGFWSGGSAVDLKATATYQWQRNGVNITSGTGHTSREYTLQAADSGTQVRCVVTMPGPVSATSNAVTVP